VNNRDDGIDTDAGWKSIRWQIGLETPPEIVSLGVGVHGWRGKERYLLSDLWCFHLYPYTATVRLGNRLFRSVRFRRVDSPEYANRVRLPRRFQHLFVHFRCTATNATERILAMQDLGFDFSRFYGKLERAVQGVGLPPHRAQAQVWDMLCELTERAGTGAPDTPATHPAVQYAVSQIELRMGETLSVADLAREAYVSYSYLGRLFQAAFGTTVVGYIRARRMQYAEHLLQHSTLPIKIIAATVGIPDLHLFNKTVRLTFGNSPRALRLSANEKRRG